MRLSMLVLLIAAAIGCQSTAPPGAKTETVSAAAYPQVVALDGLDKFLAADRPRVRRAESGAMSVSVPVRILRKRDVKAQYRFTFFDEMDRPLRPEMDWQYKVLPGRAQTFLEGVAMDSAAAEWRLEIRSAR